MYKITANFVKGLLATTGSSAKVFGKEHLPADGGFIIACTHTGYVDILNLGVSVLPREIHFMAKKQLFDIKGLGWFIDKLNAFPVDRENPGPSVIKVPRQLIKEGKIVGIFPSGTRNAESSELKQGAITIAQLARAPIVPAAYVGPNNAKDVFGLKRQAGYLVFGEPFTAGVGKDGRDEATKFLEQELLRLTDVAERRRAEDKRK